MWVDEIIFKNSFENGDFSQLLKKRKNHSDNLR